MSPRLLRLRRPRGTPGALGVIGERVQAFLRGGVADPFRVVLGVYLVAHFAHLVPWAAEVWSAAGVLPDVGLSPLPPLLPNALLLLTSPAAVQGFVVALVGLALLFTFGVARRATAVALWYGWACLFGRNPLIANPSLPYVGLLLLLCAAAPTDERRGGRRELVAVAWALLALGYTYSGVTKLGAPSWQDGSALAHVLRCPLARDTGLRELLLAAPPLLLQLATWGALALELLFLPLAVLPATRRLAWGLGASLHVGTLALVGFADLSLGMLLVHLFTWPVVAAPARVEERPAATPRPALAAAA